MKAYRRHHAAHVRSGVLGTAPDAAKLAQKLAPRQRFIEIPPLPGRPSRNPFRHAQRGVAGPRLTFPNFSQAQSAPYESGGASKPFGLLLDETFEIKRPRDAHRRGPAETHRRQDEHKRHRRKKK